MVTRLAAFKHALLERNQDECPLYFAKVDVQSCFDTIPQARLLDMVGELMCTDTYRNGKHIEISPIGPLQRLDGGHVDPMPRKRYVAYSGSATDTKSFAQLVQDKFVGTKSHTVFVNTNIQRYETKHDLMHLLREHVQCNLVKMGKGYYRQKTGIPQGSVLSSILCNYFYAELERDKLDFVHEDGSLLLRLLDDFLLITTSRNHAECFMRVMHSGHAEYGVVVKSTKSLANFDVSLENHRIAKADSCDRFPYCGIFINTRTLEVTKKAEHPAATGRWMVMLGKRVQAKSMADVKNSLTVDLSRMPGQSFHRKALK